MVRADEAYTKFSSETKCVFSSRDDDTRFRLAAEAADSKFQHNADNLLRLTKVKIGRNPVHFTTYGLPNYGRSSRRIFGKKTQAPQPHTR